MRIDEVVLTELGGPLTVREADLGAPGDGVVQVRVEAAGVAFADVQMLRGRYYQQPKTPFVPGYDLVGRVTAIGTGVSTVDIGDRVAAMPRTGAWRSVVELPADALVPVPDEVDAAEAVALITNGVTVLQLLRAADVKQDNVIVVHGASGGVGGMLVKLGLRAGATVIGTASEGKHDAVRELGAEPLDYHRDDLLDAVHALAPDGVHAVFDHFGGASVARSWRMLGNGGVLACYGAASTNDDSGHRLLPYVKITARLAYWNTRSKLGLANGRRALLYAIEPNPQFRTDLTELLALLHAGEVKPVVAQQLPLAQAAEALRLLSERQVTGKLVLVPPHPVH